MYSEIEEVTMNRASPRREVNRLTDRNGTPKRIKIDFILPTIDQQYRNIDK